MSIFHTSEPLTDEEFRLFQAYVYDKAGIRLQDHKKALVENRLRKRLRELRHNTYKDYYNFLTSPVGAKEESSHFIDAITTNETYFFRHTPLWKYLSADFFPTMAESIRKSGGQITIWSAACSTGEEPYSVAIAALETVPHLLPNKVRILASDISQQVVNTAKAGLYRPYAVSRMPKQYLTKYFKKTSDRQTGEERFQLAPEVLRLVQFRLHNLKFPPPVQRCDLVLLRNVMIYFDGPTKDLVLTNIVKGLTPAGVICVGEAESLTNLINGFVYVQPSVFRRCTSEDVNGSVPRGRLTIAKPQALSRG